MADMATTLTAEPAASDRSSAAAPLKRMVALLAFEAPFSTTSMPSPTFSTLCTTTLPARATVKIDPKTTLPDSSPGPWTEPFEPLLACPVAQARARRDASSTCFMVRDSVLFWKETS